jgi:hypothetical protein
MVYIDILPSPLARCPKPPTVTTPQPQCSEIVSAVKRIQPDRLTNIESGRSQNFRIYLEN